MAPVTRWFAPTAIVRRGSTERGALPGGPFVQRIRDTIKERACTGLKARDAIRAAGPRSRRSVELRFREITGHTVLDEINDERLANAKRLLANRAIKITAIASLCGWSSDGYFRRFFKARTGLSPSEFRRQS